MPSRQEHPLTALPTAFAGRRLLRAVCLSGIRHGCDRPPAATNPDAQAVARADGLSPYDRLASTIARPRCAMPSRIASGCS
jgi:hypothetical protein